MENNQEITHLSQIGFTVLTIQNKEIHCKIVEFVGKY